ncbi:MAG: glycosyltransferase [Lachnospiraceae bacterium]|nr:glycosyltransferase [Lachnospiraceae bacterium]
MISVCMGIYNGEKYIEEQLHSILYQTLPPSQVVLCDDGSKDNTVAIVRSFIRNNGLEGRWKLYCNEKNKGYPDNFYYAMSLCKEKYVFLADQDDIWEPHKLESMVAIMEAAPQAKAVSCKFGLIDAEGDDIHTLMAPTRNRATGITRNVSCEDVFYKCEWPGMVLAYRREWYETKFGKWQAQNMDREKKYPEIPHDFLVCAWAAEDGGFLQLDEELAWHRRHNSNTGGEEHRLAKLLNRTRKLAEIEKYNAILDAFDKLRIMESAEGRQALEDKKRVMRERYEALLSGSVRKVAANAWRNRKFTRGVTAVCDLVIACKKGRE